jgi:hypothetical protein
MVKTSALSAMSIARERDEHCDNARLRSNTTNEKRGLGKAIVGRYSREQRSDGSINVPMWRFRHTMLGEKCPPGIPRRFRCSTTFFQTVMARTESYEAVCRVNQKTAGRPRSKPLSR